MSRRIEICYPHHRGVHVLKDSDNEDILKALMGVRTDGHLGRLLLPLVLPDEHTVRLHSAGFRAMVEAAAPLDPHMKGRFYPSDIFGASSNAPVHRLSVHQDPSSSNVPMRSMGSFSGALSVVQEAFSSLHIRILPSPQTPLNILRVGDTRGAHQGERQSPDHESVSTASNSSISARVSIDDDDDDDDDDDVFLANQIRGYENRPGPCMTTDEALLAWAKNPKRFEKGGDRWDKMIAELEQKGL
jgi:hypothetical protein